PASLQYQGRSICPEAGGTDLVQACLWRVLGKEVEYRQTRSERSSDGRATIRIGRDGAKYRATVFLLCRSVLQHRWQEDQGGSPQREKRSRRNRRGGCRGNE